MIKRIALVGALLAASSSAYAFKNTFVNLGLFGGYGFIVNKVLTHDDDIRAYGVALRGFRVGENGMATNFEVQIQCSSPGNIIIDEDDKFRQMNWRDRKRHVASRPHNGGYFAMYDKYCPAKARGVSNYRD